MSNRQRYIRAWKGGNRRRKCGEIVLVTVTHTGYVGYFRNDIGADAIFYVDTYSCMDSGMNIYDTAHREDAAIAFPGDETGCGAVALLPALEIGVKFTLIGYARLRPLDSGSGKQSQ